MALEAVIDASVFLAWLCEEDLTSNAERLFSEPMVIHVPFLCDLEVAHVLQRKVRRGELDEPAAVALFAAYERVGKNYCYPNYLEFIDHFSTGVTPYDQMYLNASAGLNIPLITADRQLIGRGAVPLSSF